MLTVSSSDGSQHTAFQKSIGDPFWQTMPRKLKKLIEPFSLVLLNRLVVCLSFRLVKLKREALAKSTQRRY